MWLVEECFAWNLVGKRKGSANLKDTFAKRRRVSEGDFGMIGRRRRLLQGRNRQDPLRWSAFVGEQQREARRTERCRV